MKAKIFCTALSLLASSMIWAASPINYDGNTLTFNNDFTRSESGTMQKSVMPETSGLAASRVTPGYLWAHGDENTGSNRKIVAVQPNGTLAMTVNLNTTGSNRDDWEDIATGVYNNTNYLFVGAIGDNNLEFKDAYYIFYLVEPAITSGTQTLTANYIRFGFPDNKAHNAETLMYDNIEQMFYIVDKVKSGVCHLYKLPFRTDYGTSKQTLTEVCALGNGSKFNYCTGGDITPDGKYMVIKSKPYLLLWQRQGSESLSQTALRLPQQVAAYQEEEQGESIAWTDSMTFYTTSDSKSNTPIYKYVRQTATPPSGDTTVVPVNPTDSAAKAVYEVRLSNAYNAYINEGETIIRGWYLQGETAPEIISCVLSEGATWIQNGNTMTVTALDGSQASYTLDFQPVTPVAFTNDEITFDGSETWVKSAYGWASDKKWRFSKTDDDYSREIAGKTHVELFLPACDTVILKSMSSKEREVYFYINGEALGSKTKLLVNGNTLVVNRSQAFMLSVVSAQTSGDGGVAAIRMGRKSATGIENLSSANPNGNNCRKILRNGTLLILRDGETYNAQGIKQP
jgi:hypothetical protein